MFDADAMTKLMSRLSASRPVFHSEADFQHALAWESHQTWPQQLVRLETRPAKGIYLDVLLIDRLAGREVALELKYLTASWQGVARQDSLDLLSQGAQDIRAYDCIKDIAALKGSFTTGQALMAPSLCSPMTRTTGLHAHTVGSLTPTSFASMRAQRFRV